MTHASVFSGIGGPEVAATMLGWENLFHCEINPFGRAVLDYWYPNSASYEDITNTDFSEWRGKVDVLTGGFPCQPFSYAGQRRGAQDDRYLWPYMFRCIDQVQPTWVVAENVAGIQTMVEQGEVSAMATQGTLFDEVDAVRRYQLRETFTLQRICDDLERHGYEVQPVLIPACAVGAPHRRDRVFIVARRIASDTDNRADRRTAREDEGKGREERIQERHEVRKPDEPNQVRPESGINGEARYEEPTKGGRPSADTEGNGDSRRPRQVCGEERRPSELNAESCINGKVRAVADTSHDGHLPRVEARNQGELSGATQRKVTELHDTTQADGSGRTTADTSCGDNRTSCEGRRIESKGQDITQAERRWREWSEWTGGLFTIPQCDELGIRWQNFPSVSPVHRGNDGIPVSLDNLTISFGKWRTEALKAYGNAIVPQVMYEIFRAIEIAESI